MPPTKTTGDPLDDRRWRAALYALALIGSVDLVQLIILIIVFIYR